MKHLFEALLRQMGLNQDRNLLSPGASAALDIDPTFLAALEELAARGKRPPGEAGDELPDRLTHAAADALVDRLYSINQYLQVSEEQKAELAGIYRQTWHRIVETRDVEAALRTFHHPRLSEWVTERYPQTLRRQLRTVGRVGQVTCLEYSADLQVTLYGLVPSEIREPVLDLGCGPHGALVRRLRVAGVEAYGIDRVLSAREPYLEEADWLEAPSLRAQWGTIISNMAFSNHFRFVAAYDEAQKPRYRRRFIELVESLVPGGAFHYGPAVPELEESVDPGRFQVETRPAGGALQVARITRKSD